MLKKLFSKKYQIEGLQIKPSLKAASLDIIKIDKVNSLVYPLTDAKLNEYTPTVKTGDKVLKEQVIANAENAHGLKILAAADGTVENIDTVKAPLAQKTARAIIIKPDNTNYCFDDVLYNIDVNVNDYSKEIIFQKTVQANIQGLGGGLFLAAKKMQAKTIKHIIINAVECEPILNCDEAILTHYLAESLTGALLVQKATGAKTVTIVLKENKTKLIEHIKHFVQNNSQFNNIAVMTVPDAYPAGAEKEIIRHLFNKRLTSKDLSVDNGYLMQNAMTCVSIFRAVCADCKQLERVISIFGKNIDNPKNVLAPIGTTAEDILKFLKVNNTSSIRVGGLMMGEDILDDRSINHTALLKSSSGIILNTYEEKEVSECINCGECTKVCPVDLEPVKMFKAIDNDDFENKYLRNIADCMNCNLCNFVCPSNIDLVGMFKYAKQEKATITQEKLRAEYINTLTEKKIIRTKSEVEEKERIKLERKQAREKRLADKKKKELENA